MPTLTILLLLLSSGDLLLFVSRYLLIVKRNTRCKCPEWTPNQSLVKCWTALFRCHDIVTRRFWKSKWSRRPTFEQEPCQEHQLRAHLPSGRSSRNQTSQINSYGTVSPHINFLSTKAIVKLFHSGRRYRLLDNREFSTFAQEFGRLLRV